VRAATIDKLVWVFIFGGLLLVGLGLAVEGEARVLGRVLAGLGTLLALLGGVLIWVRSRMPEENDE
jgi:vacuolar-type H+-ATPase subunit I/STV1